MTKEEHLERDMALASAATVASEYLLELLATREKRAIQEACTWYRSGAEGEGRALCYIATLNEVYAMREHHDYIIRKGQEARKKMYGDSTTAA